MHLAPTSSGPEAGARHLNYSRKQKSLGLLCTNFLSLYNRDGIDVIGLDDAAMRLGVERRRIYDIVNVLESVGVLVRKAKNKYTWKGFHAIPDALKALREEGLKESSGPLGSQSSVKVSDEENDDEENENDFEPNSGSQNDRTTSSGSGAPRDNRKEKSLALLTQNFVRLFLCSNAAVISLDDAAKLLIGDAQISSVMRTKVRRIYDIANVLSSLKLIEKTHTSDSRKPAFRWLGLKGKSETETSNSSDLLVSRKRAFGADITNVSFKRNKKDTSSLGFDKSQMKCTDVEYRVDRAAALSDDSQRGTKSYQFGPFAPVTLPKVENRVPQARDWENLSATYQPRYQNPALRDLFTHYMEAWQSWYTEVAGKKPLRQTS